MIRSGFIFLALLICNYYVEGQIFEEKSLASGIIHSVASKGLMGGGAAFFDFDNDGFDDLYLTSGINRDHLYRNNGDGTFTRMSASAGIDMTRLFNTIGVSTGDINNDGYRDILVTTWNKDSGEYDRNLLFLNNGNSTFTEIGESAGLSHRRFSIGANFIDYNKDGLLDIYIINHVETTRFLRDDSGRIVGFDHDCFPNLLYRNNGDLTFTEVGTEMGVADAGCALASAATDYDMDGDLDFYIANDFGPFIIPNSLLVNQYPEELFLDKSVEAGADIQMYGMGIAVGDIDQDGDLDYYITNIGRNVMLRNDNGVFTDVTESMGIENILANEFNEYTTGWGTAFIDINNNGLLDLVVANGRIPSLPDLPTAMEDRNKLFLNNGDLTFTDVSAENNVDSPFYSRGMAWSDVDRDGDIDFIMVNLNEVGGMTQLYINQSDRSNHFVQFKLKGVESNKDAFGSKLWLYQGGQAALFEIGGGGESHCSQHSSIAHFGLGDDQNIDSLVIQWPSGQENTYFDIQSDTLHVIEESGSTSTRDKAATPSYQMDVSPIPFQKELQVTIPGLKDNQVVFELYNSQGLIVFRHQIIMNVSVGLHLPIDLPPGLYILKARTGELTLVQKLIK